MAYYPRVGALHRYPSKCGALAYLLHILSIFALRSELMMVLAVEGRTSVWALCGGKTCLLSKITPTEVTTLNVKNMNLRMICNMRILHGDVAA